MYNIAIIGCGLMGQKRAQALPACCHLQAVVDVELSRAQVLAQQYQISVVSDDWRSIVVRADIDIVIVATHHSMLATITKTAMEVGKHVLVEKPGAICPDEINELIALQSRVNVCVRVGFNHRYHPAIQKAKELVEKEEIGQLYYVRGIYGHGGRIGYQNEWRMDKSLSGGGQLYDQGMHLIDLAGFFLGNFVSTKGNLMTYYWDSAVEDNAFMVLETPDKKIAWLHASLTEWKNRFSFEIVGQHGKLDVLGLGGSYGTEKLTCYKMLPELGPPETKAWEYPRADHSFAMELRGLIDAIEGHEVYGSGLEEAKQALEIAKQLSEIKNV